MITVDNDMAGRLIAFRVDEETYKKLEARGKPSAVVKKIILDYLSDEKREEREEIDELKKKIGELSLFQTRLERRLEVIEASLRRAGLWR
ncbi:hypothetical protein L3N51_01443 [Metallosphaera sp. J1]|uniref:hypothetical protein n=1 Tax=Metallosphaera javensis (ex Hofmann et al. 2022) TaxID=99938 RepID=UPI001EDD87AF|nr:hypothetical protein [Metallosphaera javensis (ex Hofmann et al. 2022)]MCG3109153.1 hypothetical protein [Metallosphaera javensis (ex Hofmann et al. 2022)]